MNNIEPVAREFLDQKCIAVAGVSEKRQTPANAIFDTLRRRGTTVLAINPSASSYKGEPCYPDLKSLPQKPDGVMIVTRPATAEALVRQCIEAGVTRVWMHQMFGTKPRFGKGVNARMTSVSPGAVELARQNGITVIAGSCPMQFVGDPFHRCMRAFFRTIGALAPV